MSQILCQAIDAGCRDPQLEDEVGMARHAVTNQVDHSLIGKGPGTFVKARDPAERAQFLAVERARKLTAKEPQDLNLQLAIEHISLRHEDGEPTVYLGWPLCGDANATSRQQMTASIGDPTRRPTHRAVASDLNPQRRLEARPPQPHSHGPISHRPSDLAGAGRRADEGLRGNAPPTRFLPGWWIVPFAIVGAAIWIAFIVVLAGLAS